MRDGADHFLDLIRFKLNDHPRSRQVALGPSEIGHPCSRWLAYRLSAAEKGPELLPWRQTVGTAVDELISNWLAEDNLAKGDRAEWIIHKRVHVGELLPDQPITGTFDAYHVPTQTLVDLKVPGPSAIKKYRRSDESPQYRVQVHLYARGMIRAGYGVQTVAVVRLPSAGEFTDHVVKREPYDESVAIEALDRARSVAGLVRDLGRRAASVLPGTEFYCHRCPFYRPSSRDLTRGCPGAVDETGGTRYGYDATGGGLIAPK